MKITMESTSQIVNFRGIECRMWEGFTGHGVHCFALIPTIAVHNNEDRSQFESELIEQHQTPSNSQVFESRLFRG